MSFDLDEPIYVGFAGNAGSGKTYTAKALIPQQTFVYEEVEKFPAVVWDHYWFSAPLYAMASTKLTIEGDAVRDRILYQLHETIAPLMAQHIPYDELIELVYDIYCMPCEMDGIKPRNFLTQAGDRCKRDYYNCFADFVKYRVRSDFSITQASAERNQQDMPWFVAIVSDIRLPNEAEMIKSCRNNLLIKFEASEDVRTQRLQSRDGITLTEEQKIHNSETSLNKIPDDMYDFVIDTDGLSLEDQTRTVYNILKEYLPLSELEASIK